MAMIRSRVAPVIIGLVAVALGGCGFFRVPEDVAVPVSTRPIPWLLDETCSRGLLPAPSGDDLRFFKDKEYLDNAIEGLDIRSEKGPDKPAESGQKLIGRFLHVSDAQIRDDRLYTLAKDKGLFFLWDKPPVIRNSHVYSYDSLVYASFLIAYAKEVASDGKVPSKDGAFIVDGGDLLDISVVTELVEAMNIRRYVASKYKKLAVYSSCGNHDGLTWGNLRDEWTDTRGLGVNKTEFVLGHLLADPVKGRGWGFGRNEIIGRFGADDAKAANKRHWDEFKAQSYWPESKKHEAIVRWLDDIKDAAKRRQELRNLGLKVAEEKRQESGEPDSGNVPEELLTIPVAFREAIQTTSEGDRAGPPCGYYSWTVDGEKVRTSVRYIVLDTRSNVYADGRMGDVQLGWLCKELVEANKLEQFVVIFAHHAPDRFCFWEPNRSAFHNVLGSFPNIIAYFYGHEHWNEDRHPRASCGKDVTPHGFGNFLLSQTASVNDFPQTAREVWIYERKHDSQVEVTLWWRHVRPKPDEDRVEGRLLDACLRVSRRGAKKDRNDQHFGIRPIDSIKDWEKKHLRRGQAKVYPRFLEPTSKALDPEWLLGPERVEKINNRRDALGLTQVQTVDGRGK
jgi:hypothetical protein